MATTSRNQGLSYFKTEDWLSLAAGLVVLTLVIVGLPFFPIKWDASASYTLPIYFTASLLVSAPVLWLTGKTWKAHLASLALLFALAIAAIYITSIPTIKQLGLEYVIFALLLGITIRNLVKHPSSLWTEGFSEYFVKVGLVLLGSSVVFGDLLKAGSLGLIQALVVVLLVWYVAFLLGKWLKIDKEMNLMIASAVSICGVSAAIATSGVIKGDNKKLSYVVSLVLVVAIPMLILMPLAAKHLHLPDAVAGAWLGGTIDTTGAVVAAGELLGPDGLKYCTVVKFSQNILLGLAALAISIYWSFTSTEGKQAEVSGKLIWDRFPKFVLGFILVSLLYSFALPKETVSSTKDSLKTLQTVFFAISFVSIGLETDLRALLKTGEGKPAIVFLSAQAFNIVLTLVVAYVLFAHVA